MVRRTFQIRQPRRLGSDLIVTIVIILLVIVILLMLPTEVAIALIKWALILGSAATVIAVVALVVAAL